MASFQIFKHQAAVVGLLLIEACADERDQHWMISDFSQSRCFSPEIGNDASFALGIALQLGEFGRHDHPVQLAQPGLGSEKQSK